MSDLGATYFQGIELPRDHSTAFGWFERSATAGYTLAFVNLATCYREGLGCPKDERKALECYKVVAEVETDAMELLGEIYMNGDCGVAKDPREGAYWFRRGAEAGSPECSYRWGVCCATGTGAERDFGNAAEAFRFAAERGHAGAALDLGHCLCMASASSAGRNRRWRWRPTRKPRRRGYPRRATTWDARGSTATAPRAARAPGRRRNGSREPPKRATPRRAPSSPRCSTSELRRFSPRAGFERTFPPRRRGTRERWHSASRTRRRRWVACTGTAWAGMRRRVIWTRRRVGSESPPPGATTRRLRRSSTWRRRGCSGIGGGGYWRNTTPPGRRSCPRLRSRRRLRTTT